MGLIPSTEQYKTTIRNNSESIESFSELESSKAYADTNNLTYRYEWGEKEAFNKEVSPPNVEDILDNVTSFAGENNTIYLGDDVIPESLMEGVLWSYMVINLTAIRVKEDHNAWFPGDIYIRWAPNFWIGPPEYDENKEWINYQYYETGIYSIEDEVPAEWTNFSTPITLFEDWTVLSCLLLEVFEYDVLSNDESLGGFYWNFEDPSSLEGYYEISCTDVDVAIEISILSTDTEFTAENLTELFQPFLFDNDDTSHTADPDALFARVIHGYDPSIGSNAFCIQYLYYWSEVWLDGFWSDQLIHYDDYELFQVYLNFSYTGGPVAYRFVFDNHDEYTNSKTEWRDSMEYAIYEWDVPDTGILHTTVNNSVELQPLLGEKYNASYEYKNLSDYVDCFCGCFGGVASLILTIETYNHQFAIGRTGGDFLGQYYIDPYDDTIIYNCYALLNWSFTKGVHDVNGESVPNYAPFAYDVLQVFAVPYIHSNYANLMKDAAQFQGSVESEGGFINVQRSVNFTFTIPLKTNVDLPDVLKPGDNLTTILETLLDESKAVLIIDYYFNITANCSVFFVQKYFETIVKNRIVIDFSNPQVQLLNKFLDFCFDRIFSIDIGDYVTIDLKFTPQLLGEILNCNITVHLIEILGCFYPQYATILNLFFKDIYLKINPIISGYLSAKIKLGTSNQTIIWDTETKNFNFKLKIPDLSYGDNLSLELINFTYGLNFLIDWYLGYIPSWILKFIIGDGDEFHLVQYPNMNFDLASILGNVTLKTWKAYATTWGIASDVGGALGAAGNGNGGGGGDGNDENAVPGYDCVIIIGIIGIVSVILYKKRFFYKTSIKK